jgi:hypothetical protein
VIQKEVDMLEQSLQSVNMIKGNVKTLQKIRHDLELKMHKLTGDEQVSSSQFQKSVDSP